MSSDICAIENKILPLQPLKCLVSLVKHFLVGAIAQLVEQRTENPCVPGSIPGGTTLCEESCTYSMALFFVLVMSFSFRSFSPFL